MRDRRLIEGVNPANGAYRLSFGPKRQAVRLAPTCRRAPLKMLERYLVVSVEPAPLGLARSVRAPEAHVNPYPAAVK